jgi:hypothetical protein
MHGKIAVNIPDYFHDERIFKSGQCDVDIKVTYTINIESLRTTDLVKTKLLQFTFGKEGL